MTKFAQIKDVGEEVQNATFKAYLREKTHMFQWTRRFCFITR